MIADKVRADAATAKLESEWKFAAMVRVRYQINQIYCYRNITFKAI